MATPPTPIQLFDIPSAPPVRTYAPNPWKARYALNIKALNYRTEWVSLFDIPRTRRAHNVAPVRHHADGSEYPTLPMMRDASADGAVKGDSFDIALHLDRTYPDAGLPLFPPGSIGVHRAFNAQVDALFSRHVKLCVAGLPWTEEEREAARAEFVRRAPGVTEWSQLVVEGEGRREALSALEGELGTLAEVYRFDDGPFLEGGALSYADVVVAGWLAFLKETLPEWDELCAWQGGRWKRLHEEMQQYAELK